MFSISISPPDPVSPPPPSISLRLLEFAHSQDSKLKFPHTARPEEEKKLEIPTKIDQMPHSPRSQRNPSNRFPSALFPSTHLDRRGFLLPPVANPDLPPMIDGGGDSFWIGENLEDQKIKEERQKKLRAAHAQPRPKFDSPDENRFDSSSDELFWSDVIDVAIVLGSKNQKFQTKENSTESKTVKESRLDTEVVD